MERIQRALELARAQRGSLSPAPGSEVSPIGPPPGRAAASAGAAAARDLQSGEVPSARSVRLDRDALRERRIVLAEDGSAAGRAYRMLRTQLLRRVRASDSKLIGIVSTVDGEGKTITAINLAMSVAAEPNQTVLLVDLDLRHPSIAPLLGLDVPAGLESWFQAPGSGVGELFVGLEGIERLRILPTLRPVSGSSEALASTRTRELLGELKSRYSDRLMIVDLPPLLLTDDVLTIAPLLDGVLVVVTEGRTKREDVTRLKELLGNVRILGTLLNLSSESETRAY